MKHSNEIESNDIFLFKRKKFLINIFTVIGCLIFLSSALNNYVLGDSFSSFVLIGFCFSILISQLFFLKNKVETGIAYFFMTIIFAIFYFDSYSGVDSGTYLYFFPLTLGIANLFDYRFKKDQHFLHVLLSMIVMVALVNILTNHTLFENKALTSEQKNQMFIFNFIFALSSLGYFVFLIVQGNLKRLNLVEEKLVVEKEKLQLQEAKNKQNEILLAELQHRLKNNLSLMSSLLKLKMERNLLKSQEKTNAEILHAIQTVALGNHLQIFNETIIFVPIKKYIELILKDWTYSEVCKKSNTIQLSIKDSQIPVKQAISLGLIVHEMLCLFELNEENKEEIFIIHLDCNVNGICKISFKTESGSIQFFNYQNNLNLIEALIDQLDGKLEINYKEIDCSFPILENSPLLESQALFN